VIFYSKLWKENLWTHIYFHKIIKGILCKKNNQLYAKKFNYEKFYKNKKVYYTLFLSFFVYNKIHFFCIIRYNIIIPGILFKTEHFISMSLFLLRNLFFYKYVNKHIEHILMFINILFYKKNYANVNRCVIIWAYSWYTNCGSSTDTHHNAILSAVSENGSGYLIPYAKMELMGASVREFRRFQFEKGQDCRS